MMMNRHLQKFLPLFTLFVSLIAWASASFAGDLPTAAGSPIAGISFDDRPLMLPVQRNFQMAMLTASSELGRSCGKMEAYGWRMAAEEQDRVNLIFNNTVDRMRAQGFAVESKKSNAVSRDVTLFTADRADRHLIFLWSAGEIGLVMVLCDTSAPLSAIPERVTRNAEPTGQPSTLPSYLPMAETVRGAGKLAGAKEPVSLSAAGKPLHAAFKPTGRWVGNYTCSQGTTGATLQIDKIKGDQFEGTFSFYPTSKNPYVPKGKYAVFGEYDADSQRILINPGKWLERPKDFYNTIMIGSFDPVAKTFSGCFQGIMGCTSFEAHIDDSKVDMKGAVAIKGKKNTPKIPVKTPAKAKSTAKPKVEKTSSVTPVTQEVKPEAKVVTKAASPSTIDPVSAPTPTQAKTLPSYASTAPATAAPPVKAVKDTAKDAMAIVKDPAPVTGRASSIEPPAGILIGTSSGQK